MSAPKTKPETKTPKKTQKTLPKAPSNVPEPKRKPGKAVVLPATTRLARLDIEGFAEASALVGNTLLVSGYDRKKQRTVVLAYRADERDVWRDDGAFEVPIAPGRKATLTFEPQGATTVSIEAVYLAAEGDADEARWGGALDLAQRTLTPTSEAPFEGDCRVLARTDRTMKIELRDGKTLALEDPDPHEERYLASVVVTPTSIWVTSPLQYDAMWTVLSKRPTKPTPKTHPRVYELDRATGKHKRTVLFKNAPPSLGMDARSWNDGLLLAAGHHAIVTFVPFGGGEPVSLTDEEWVRKGTYSQESGTTVAVSGDVALIGAPHAAKGAGRVLVLDRHLSFIADLKLSDAKKEDNLGAQLRASGPWAALTVARKAREIQLVRVENGVASAVAPEVARGPTREELFEAKFPGFLAGERLFESKFKSWQLKAVVWEFLAREGHIAPFDVESFVRLYPKRAIDPEEMALIKEAAACLHHYVEEPPELLSKLKTLTFDGGASIQQQLYPEWDGEDGAFDVKTFAGIEQCTGLEVIKMISCVEGADLAPLARLPALREVYLGGGYVLPKNAKSLAKAPSLKKVSVGERGAKEMKKDLDVLRAAGIEVIKH